MGDVEGEVAGCGTVLWVWGCGGEEGVGKCSF